ncbi:putative mitochondrial protein AtMg00310 [Silene latifolia]|uniref:putative mitochondrial protein AtMg00310 n=1 Tax=Silene latifolia TaxID=37657 RepID=UPI003D784452
MAATPIPLGICRKIDSLISAFWWRKDLKRHSIHRLARDFLHQPRQSGGLGIKNVHLLSQSSLLKNLWRIHLNPTGLLAKYLVPKYRKDLPFPSTKSQVSQPSFLWSGICQAARSCSPAFAWKIGNGRLINLFTSSWVNGEIPSPQCAKDIIGMEPPSLDIDDFLYWKFTEDGVYMVKSGYSISDLLTSSGDWNPLMVFRYFQPQCAEDIIAMEPPSLDIDDFLYWKFTEDAVYMVKS